MYLKKAEFDLVYKIESNLDNNVKTFKCISKLYELLNSSYSQKVLLDFSGVEFISANLFAIIGAVLDECLERNNHDIFVRGLNDKIRTTIAKNGFNKYLNIESIPDTYKNCVKYTIFEAHTEQLVEFEKYILLYIMGHDGIPIMSEVFKNHLIDNFLEIFNNVIDHSESDKVYVCGQFFYTKKTFCFSIVDIGITFEDKISTFFNDINIEPPEKKIEWALEMGHSTKKNEPGGLGLTTLFDFIQQNNGDIFICSGRELFEMRKGRTRTTKPGLFFPGTVVTTRINLNDNKLYLFDEESDVSIVF